MAMALLVVFACVLVVVAVGFCLVPVLVLPGFFAGTALYCFSASFFFPFMGFMSSSLFTRSLKLSSFLCIACFLFFVE